MIKSALVLTLIFVSVSVFAKQPNCQAKRFGPACQQICSTCEAAGFIQGEAKVGDGLWVDCIRPIMAGTGEPAKGVKAGKSLPAAPGGGTWDALRSQCQASNPGFGLKK
jgi:hypothetical protein